MGKNNTLTALKGCGVKISQNRPISEKKALNSSVEVTSEYSVAKKKSWRIFRGQGRTLKHKLQGQMYVGYREHLYKEIQLSINEISPIMCKSP